MKKKVEHCAYCQKARKVYRCGGMLSAHCKDCCAFNCSGKKKVSLVDEAMTMAREMGGASWPSADSTKWAMMNLIARLVHHFEACGEKPMGRKRVIKELLDACGISRPSRRKMLEDAVARGEAELK